MFGYPARIRRFIYITNAVEGYYRQLRKVIKTKGSLHTTESVRKLLYLVNQNITDNLVPEKCGQLQKCQLPTFFPPSTTTAHAPPWRVGTGAVTL